MLTFITRTVVLLLFLCRAIETVSPDILFILGLIIPVKFRTSTTPVIDIPPSIRRNTIITASSGFPQILLNSGL